MPKKLVLPSRFLPPAERRLFGKSRRRVLPRAQQSRWVLPPGRPDPVDTLLAGDRGRLSAILPVKYGRMAASPFSFFRGAASLMAADIGLLPVTGLPVRICGDAHLRNLGAYEAPDGHLVFDINDFDEAVGGPWEWDLKRIATSAILAAREAGRSERAAADAVEIMAGAYRTSMHAFAAMPALDLARHLVRREPGGEPLHRVFLQARRSTPAQTLARLTVTGRGGLPGFRSKRPVLYDVPEKVARGVIGSLRAYREELDAGHRYVFDAYRPMDVAFKIVGTGSVGTRDFVVLLLGILPKDALFLQVKEERRSCWAPFLRGAAGAHHHGRRVAEAQHALQTISDPLLGWTTIDGRPYLVRQLSDHKASIDFESLKGRGLAEYTHVCGEAFAKGHARTGDPAALSGYLGTTDRFDRALAKFAVAYADQTEADFAAFRAAIRRGRIRARTGL